MRIRTLVWITATTALLASSAWSEAELEPELAVAAPAAEAKSEAPPTTPEPAVSTGSVARATFTTDVLAREPQDSVTTLSNDHPRVFYFSEIHGMTDRTVTHRWEYNDVLMAEVSHAIGGPRWRVFSTKSLDPSWLDDWSVTLVDDSGAVMRRDSFTYTEIVEEVDPEIPAAPAPPES